MSSASRLRGRLCWGDTTATFDFRQAKAAAKSEKGIRFFNSCGEPVAAIDLNESGWHAHARVLDALMQPAVDMRHTLADALEVSRLVDVARAKAGPETSYLPADLPVFLREA